MIGPPFLKLSIKKFELNIPGFGVGAGVAGGLALAATVAAGVIPGAGDSSVTGTEAPGLGIVPGGCNPVASGGGGGTGGFKGAAGLVVVGKVDAGLPVAGAAGVIPGGGASSEGGADAVGSWPKAVSANAVEQRQAVSSVFICGLIYRLEFR